MGLCPQGEGIQVAQPLQGLVGWEGGEWARRWGLLSSLHADSLGMLQAGGQAAGRQRAPRDGQAAFGDREGRRQTRQMGARTWGPAAQRRHCRDRPDRGLGQNSRFLRG